MTLAGNIMCSLSGIIQNLIWHLGMGILYLHLVMHLVILLCITVIKIFLHFIFQALDGFVIVLTREFEVFYASETVQDYLGLAQVHLTSYT